jgi:hypothetical protein
LWAIAHENGPKTQKWRVFSPTQTCTKCPGPCKSPGIPKLWAIAHEKGYKRKNNEILVMSLKYLLSAMGLVHYPRTPKLWAHENGPKTQKQRVFGHASQTCTKCHGPCKLPRNPKTMGNSSWKRP